MDHDRALALRAARPRRTLASLIPQLPQRNLVHGDSLSFSIAAASILAKTGRDAALVAWDAVFPGFGLASNKGYSSPDHLSALRRLGPTPLHRFSFEPVRSCRPASPGSCFRWDGYPLRLADCPPQQGVLFA